MCDTDLRQIGQRVAAERRRRQMTQSELAAACDLSLKTISMLETGQRQLKIETLISLCQYLEVSADYLLFGVSLDGDAKYIQEKLASMPPDAIQPLKDLLDALN